MRPSKKNLFLKLALPVSEIIIATSVGDADDSDTNYIMDGIGDEGIESEEGDNKGRCCRSPQNVGGKE